MKITLAVKYASILCFWPFKKAVILSTVPNATNKSSVPGPLASNRDIRVVVSQNHAQARCSWVRMSPKYFESLIGGSFRKALFSHD